MNDSLHALFTSLHAAAAAAQAQDEKWLIIDAVYEHLEELQAQPLAEVLPRILALIESFPELDYGGPGPFGSLIEEHPLADYTPALLDSLQRQPSTQVIGWLDRAARTEGLQLPGGPNPVRPQQFSAVLRQVLAHPEASADCREFALICLKDLPQ